MPLLKVLFVCSQNHLRSPTAEAVFSGQPGLEVMSAGTSSDAENPICADLIDWADLIFVMEQVHRKRLNQQFRSRLRAKKIIVLGVPDKFNYMDPALVAILREKVPKHLP